MKKLRVLRRIKFRRVCRLIPNLASITVRLNTLHKSGETYDNFRKKFPGCFWFPFIIYSESDASYRFSLHSFRRVTQEVIPHQYPRHPRISRILIGNQTGVKIWNYTVYLPWGIIWRYRKYSNIVRYKVLGMCLDPIITLLIPIP